MVSFWPFKGEDDAASFEKTLRDLSRKIQNANGKNEYFRQHQRRDKALWTLYSVFAYILVAAILTLVTGYDRWGSTEYGAVAGGPLVIYSVRVALDTYYYYRLSRGEEYLSRLKRQREQAIERLKTATKYNSTQRLLDKYGEKPRQPQHVRQASSKGGKGAEEDRPGSGGGHQAPPAGRTGFVPPPTANIPARNPPPPTANIPAGPPAMPDDTRHVPLHSPTPPAGVEPGEEFAPNAFSNPQGKPAHSRQQSRQYAPDGPRWYDRIVDVILGEDETQARNRLALICGNCRLVNGLAPPGATTLEDVGKWKCGSCHAWNGVENETNRVLRHAAGEPLSPVSATFSKTSSSIDAIASSSPSEAKHDQGDEDDNVEANGGDLGPASSAQEDSPPAASTRSKAKERQKT